MTKPVVWNCSRTGYVIEFKSGKVSGTGRQTELHAIVWLSVRSNQNRRICLSGLHRLSTIESDPSPKYPGAANFTR
jgi:hypothetical protein